MAETISASEFRDMVDAARRGEREFALVDTRPEESYAGWRIAGAINYVYKPFHAFDRDEFEDATGIGPGETVVTVCAKGKSSHALADDLAAAGYEDVYAVDDGMRGWSSVYDRVEVPLLDADEEPLDVVQIQRRAKGCLGYLVVGGYGDGHDAEDSLTVADSAGSRVAVAVDVSRHGEEWRAAAADHDASIAAVLDTHVHADHLSGGRALADELGVPYVLPAAAAERDVAYEFEPIGRNRTLDVGGVDLKALATPGHTDDGASYLVGRSAVLTGDTLFTEGVGRTELQFAAGGESEAGHESGNGGTERESAGARTGAERLYDSLHGTLLAEPDDVVVLPGHFSVDADGTTGGATPGEPVATTVGDARTGLEVLGRDRAAFVEEITATLPEKPPNYESVIAANRGVESPRNEVAAIELELGPNRCAAEPAPEPEADD
ncbi:thiosulfate/3-mercaptopyruvate sulfurtransferase [Halorubrum aquaticum]|uniref:Thiosulfate/3-mercaptopyruvate sulfurtransferase n=1 Tax=Halorubrum aquaticum TaxID=387340 RepID=A0A1I3BGW6_9EURY|nr:rhodanese-like domain-containing protein [Halorubrum aquaticum]SFH61522.1 thiosulfate/3-mercaptopyruvate sulfurtransferase [Halorubrum aquaticum]